MTDPMTCRLGPITTVFSGDDPLVDWARRTYHTAPAGGQGDLAFHFHDQPLSGIAGAVRDERFAVTDSAFSFRARYFDVEIHCGAGVKVDLYRRDRRGLVVRSLKDIEETWKLWLSHGASLDLHPIKEFAYQIGPLAQLVALLRKDAALIHASCFEHEGRALLLPAWGGVGKSTLVSRACLHGAARFLADDLAVIDSSGRSHVHLLPIHVYAYHLNNDPLLRERALAGCSAASRRQWPIGSRLRPRKAVRWVEPAALFTEAKLGTSAPIEQVITMYRADIDEFDHRPCTADEAASSSANVLLREVAMLTERLAAAASGPTPGPLPSADRAAAELQRIFVSSFERADCSRLLVPRSAKPNDLVEYLRQHSGLLDSALKQTA